MANNHVRPGQSVTWRNVTGAPVRSGALVPFGGGVAAKALHDIPADAEGEVTLFQVHRLPLPAGLSFSPGDLVHVQDGQISDSGDLLGRFIRLDQGGWAEILILPLTEGGGGGGTSDIAWKPTVSAEGEITWTRTSSTTAPAAQNIKGPQGDPGPQGPQGEKGDKGDKGDPGAAGDAKTFVATYNVTTAAEILAYLDSANEPFAPILVKRGNDYYTAALATRSGTDGVIVRVMGSGSGDYIIFNYTVRGSVWSSSSYTFQKKLVSGTDIKTINGESLLGAGNVEVATVEMATLHRLTFRDQYDLGAQTDIAAYVAGMGRAVGPYDIANLLPLAVTVGDYAWTGPDADMRQHTNADLTVTFPDGSFLVAAGVSFVSDYSVPGRIYAARLDDGAGPIDTGLTMDYSYTFFAEGYVPEGKAGVLVGAYTSNSERTTVRILGGSNKVQAMWPGLYEVQPGELDVREIFRYTLGKGTIFVDQPEKYSDRYNNSNWQTTGTGAAKIYLFDESDARQYRFGILREVRIYDENRVLIRCFQPAKLPSGEIVIMDAANNNQIYRPTSGNLLEVAE